MNIKLKIVMAGFFLVSACSNADIKDIKKNEIVAKDNADEHEETLPRMLAIQASYCSVCREMKPLIERIKAECNLDDVRVDTVDVSEEKYEYLLEEYRIKGLPTYLFIDEANYEVARLVGAQTESALKQALGVLRGEDCPNVGKIKNQKGS